MERDPAVTALVVGIGFSSEATALEIASLVRACLDGRVASSLAVPVSRASFGAAQDAARLLALPLAPIDDGEIDRVQGRCLTRPCRAVRAVAEGAALAAAGDGAQLLGPRRKERRVTCALAVRP